MDETTSALDPISTLKIEELMAEFDSTMSIFGRPKDKRTEDYITGRFG